MRKLPETITEEELKQIIKAEKHDHHRLGFILGFYQGMRISEVVGLGKRITKCCKVEPKRTFYKNEYGQRRQRLNCSKCGKEVHNDILKRSCIEWLIPPLEKKQIYNDFIHIKNAKGNKDRNIPLAKEVEPYLDALPIELSERSLGVAFKRMAKNVLGKDMHFHCLRHSAGTHYLNVKKWNIRLVQDFLGHSSIATTQIYTHVNPSDLLNAMRGEC